MPKYNSNQKQLLRVSCILWCYYPKCYLIIFENASLWCFINNVFLLCMYEKYLSIRLVYLSVVCARSSSRKCTLNVVKLMYVIQICYRMFLVKYDACKIHGLCTATHKRIPIHSAQWMKKIKSELLRLTTIINWLKNSFKQNNVSDFVVNRMKR